MRTKENIIQEAKLNGKSMTDFYLIEILLDIRDLLKNQRCCSPIHHGDAGGGGTCSK